MKTTFILSLALCVQFAHAQYFQRGFNIMPAPQPGFSDYEAFHDGLCTRNNYSGNNPANFYQVSTGTYYGDLPGVPATGFDNAMRFVRTNRTGTTVNVNNGYHFSFSNGSPLVNSQGRSIAEINNGLGTGGYVIVGEISDNAIMNSDMVPGSGDALLLRMTNSGTVANSYRLDFSGGNDRFNGVIASTVIPGEFYACGYSEFPGYTNLIVARFNSTGTLRWGISYQLDPTWAAGDLPDAECIGWSLAENPANGNITLAGSFNDPGLPFFGTNGLLMTLDSNGTVIASITHELSTDDQYRSIKYTSDSCFILCGYSNFNLPLGAPPLYDMWITKIETNILLLPLFSTKMRVMTGLPLLPAPSFAFDVTERINSIGAIEYTLAGTHMEPLIPFVFTQYRVNALGLGINNESYFPVAYNDQMAIDNGLSSSPGIRAFTNFGLPPAPAIPRIEGLIMRSYNNLASCTDNCMPQPPMNLISPVVTFPVSFTPVGFARRFNIVSISQIFNTNLNCSQTSVPCGSNN